MKVHSPALCQCRTGVCGREVLASQCCHLGVANHTVCRDYGGRTRREECKSLGHSSTAHNVEDDSEDEATTKERRILRRVVGKSQFLAPRWQTSLSPRTAGRGHWQNLQRQTS